MGFPKIFGRSITLSVGVAAAVTMQKLQIINDREQFLPGLDDQLTDWGLQDASMDYEVVAVVGSQSSGKSTLLNHLFQTDFAVMDPETRGRTTNGIWLSRARSNDIIVMDVEGSDGASREDNQTFEHKSALFALATSRALVVNMWENQVGLYNGGNMGLLRVILEEYLSLFGELDASEHEPPQILFVIQAHSGTTSLTSLSRTITADLERMWEGLAKPSSLTRRGQLKDHFNFQFESLPHIVWAPDAYKKAIGGLKTKFFNKGNPNYVFKQTRPPTIPASGLEVYMKDIWEKIRSSDNLNLPSQHELLAGAICDRIGESIIRRFRPHLTPHFATINQGQVIENLGSQLRSWRSDILDQYDRDTSHYPSAVHQGRRQALTGSFLNEVSVIVFGQLRNLRTSSLAAFDQTLVKSLSRDDTQFQNDVSQARSQREDDFASEVHSLRLEDSNWAFEPESQQFMDGMAERVTIREREKKLFNSPIKVSKDVEVGHRKSMTSQATLYRDGKLVVEVYTKCRNNHHGLRGRVLVVISDVNASAVGISNELRCTTRGGVWDVFTPSSGHDTFHLQLPEDVGKRAFALDIYQSDDASLGGTADRFIKTATGVVAVASALGW